LTISTVELCIDHVEQVHATAGLAGERATVFDGVQSLGMARFEQQISDDEVTAAREKIAAGASLRSAAAQIPCAPSTLSVRIRKAEQAEADARDPARSRDSEQRTAQGAPEQPDLRALAAREGADPSQVGPLEILRGALQATKASGQPDWPTRLSAARTLAALRPAELEPKTQPAPSTVVYDLPPGAEPVLHRPREAAAATSDAEAPCQRLPEPGLYFLTLRDRVITLVEHQLTGEVHSVRLLSTREDAANLLRAFGADPAFLDAIPEADFEKGAG